MSRISDTRMRTRTAAAKLVTAGHPAHAITVDLIYAEIKQGSRTTINDELKLWKDEQVKVNALSAALPDAVANSMLATWAIAIEHGEKAFEQRREEIESELTTTVARAQMAEATVGEQCARAEQLSLLLGQSTKRETAQRAEIQALRDAKDEALRLAVLAERETASVRAEAQVRESTLKSIHEQNLTNARAELAAKEVELRAELTRTTERLEGVQKHVMLQVAEARDAQKRAEDHATKAVQRGEKLGTELESMRVQLAEVQSTHQRAVEAQTAAAAEAGKLRMERDSLKEKLANTTGQLEGISKRFDALSRQLSRGQKTVLAGARPQPTATRPSATNSTKNNDA